MIQFRVHYGQLRRELTASTWRLALARAGWLALVVPLGAVVVRAAGGPIVPRWAVAAAAAAVGLAALAQPARRRAADVRAIDRRFGLDELLVTAVEVDARGPRTALEGELLERAAGRIASIPPAARTEPALLRRELETLAGVALVTLGLSILADGWRRPPLPGALDALPRRASAPDGGDAVARTDVGPGPSRAEGLLAAAIADAAIAAPVAGALQGGDSWTAAQAVRALADQADALSPLGRRELSDALRSASTALAPVDPDLAAAAAQAAEGLAQATPPAAADGLDRLADALASRAARVDVAPSRADDVAAAAATPVAGLPGGRPGDVAAGSAGGAAGGDRPGLAPAAVVGGGNGGTAGGGGLGHVAAGDREAVRRYFDRSTSGGDAP